MTLAPNSITDKIEQYLCRGKPSIGEATDLLAEALAEIRRYQAKAGDSYPIDFRVSDSSNRFLVNAEFVWIVIAGNHCNLRPDMTRSQILAGIYRGSMFLCDVNGKRIQGGAK